MVTFYPLDIDMWRGVFDFESPITLTPKTVPSAREGMSFRDRAELMEFLKCHGIRLNDAQHPLQFLSQPDHPFLTGDVYRVVQSTLVGWIVDRHG